MGNAEIGAGRLSPARRHADRFVRTILFTHFPSFLRSSLPRQRTVKPHMYHVSISLKSCNQPSGMSAARSSNFAVNALVPPKALVIHRNPFVQREYRGRLPKATRGVHKASRPKVASILDCNPSPLTSTVAQLVCGPSTSVATTHMATQAFSSPRKYNFT